MAPTEEKHSLLLKTISILVILAGFALVAYTATRLGHGPFPFSYVRILIGIVLIAAGWLTASPHSLRTIHSWLIRSRETKPFLRLFVEALFPQFCEQNYPSIVRGLLTLLMYAGAGMILWATVMPPFKLDAEFLHRYPEMGLGGIALVLTSGFLRYSKKCGSRNTDWPKPIETLLLFGVALVVVATDIHFSSKIGLLANPPYQDGVGYMVDAKRAFAQFGLLKSHPVNFANKMLGNRYPVWQALMVLNFKLFGEGEWQAYAVRFWPTFIILLAVFWVARRHIGRTGAWAAATFTSLLPTLSLNLQAAAMGHQSTVHGYLTDLRPDLLFAAFLLCAVVLLVEHVKTLDEPTALLSGICAALAVLTKSSALGALLLAWGIAIIYLVIANWHTRKNVLMPIAWAMLVFTMFLLPWALAGGLRLALQYIKDVLTFELPLYSNPHATFQSETIYYGTWYLPHMGFPGLVSLAAAIALFLILLPKKRYDSPRASQLLVYLVIGAALYLLVSTSLAKNYFLALPCYLVLWVFSLNSLAAATSLTQGWKNRLWWSVLSLGLFYAFYLGIAGQRNLAVWPSYESQVGSHNRTVMREIAEDLRTILSNDDSFMWIPAYGNPETLLFYMREREGKLPQAIAMDATIDPPPEQYVQKFIEPAKAVLVYRDREESIQVGYVHPANSPYFRAIAAWVRRPGSSHHWFKSYHFLDVDKSLNPTDLTIDLYILQRFGPAKLSRAEPQR